MFSCCLMLNGRSMTKDETETATCGQDLDVRVETESQHLALVPDNAHDDLALVPDLHFDHRHHQDGHGSATSGSGHFHTLSQLKINSYHI